MSQPKVKQKVKTPSITLELIEYLQHYYPDISPNLETTLDNIRYSSGQVSVVRHLVKLYNEQSNNLL